MNTKPDFSNSANHAATAPAYLSVWDIHAYYGESYIVQGVSFNVHEGEILALVRPQRALEPRLQTRENQTEGHSHLEGEMCSLGVRERPRV